MTWIKNHNVARTSLLLLAVALIAALLFWAMWALVSFGRGQAPAVSAQQLLVEACERTTKTDFDFKTTLHGNQNLGSDNKIVTVTYDFRVSGEDFYLAFTDEEGAFEIIVVDNVVYIRHPSEGWKLADPQPKSKMTVAGMLDSRPGHLDKAYSDNPLCPDIGAVESIGKETINGVDAEHYQVKGTGIGAPTDTDSTTVTEGLDIVWDYWINEDGQLVQARETVTLTGDGEAGQVETTTLVSGVGEPNTIEVPM